MQLKDKIILVTGGSGHLGSAISKKILNYNGSVIVASKNKEKFEKLRNNIEKKYTKNIHFFKVNLFNEGSVNLLIKKIKNKFGYINGLVNNASFEKKTLQKIVPKINFTDSLAINLYAPYLLTKRLENLLILGAKKSKTSSSIVNISSMYAIVSPDKKIYKKKQDINPIQYGANKAGLIQLSKYMACNLDNNLIRINSITPGAFPSSTKNLKTNLMLKSKIPLRRFGKPEEVAGPVVFLLSKESSYVHGTNLIVDGGWTSW